MGMRVAAAEEGEVGVSCTTRCFRLRAWVNVGAGDADASPNLGTAYHDSPPHRASSPPREATSAQLTLLTSMRRREQP
jgi:hypothetical protein